jgi:hypothetical protein
MLLCPYNSSVCGLLATYRQCRALQPSGAGRESYKLAIKITAIRQSGGSGHEHITDLWWTNPASGKTGQSSRAQLVDWIENGGGKAYVEDQYGGRADVGVVTPGSGPKYLRTHADGRWTDNLLALPRK